MKDLVSIIMPSYNTACFILESIQSVQMQTYSNWELIIVDDCSTDETDYVISEIADERIIYVKNEVNSGAAFSRNRALKMAKGRWIAFLDSDDLWESDKLEKQISFMLNNGYSFSYTKYEEINEQSNVLNKVVSGPKRITKTGMYNYCWPGCLTVMYDSSVVGLIQIEDIKKNNDYAMWLKVCQRADCYLLNEVVAKYRRRSGSISNHGYLSLIIWHYRLFKEVEKKNMILSCVLTVRNLVFGVWKKIRYVKEV